MKLLELIQQAWYHASKRKFKTFAKRPTWFSTNKRDAMGWHAIHPKSVTYEVRYTGGKIASEEQAKKIAKEIWPDDDLIYSMYDENVREFPAQEVRKFIKSLEAAGFDAAIVDDYDPHDSQADSKSICVFEPDKHVSIIKTLNFIE